MGDLKMTEKIKSELISRRTAFSLLGANSRIGLCSTSQRANGVRCRGPDERDGAASRAAHRTPRTA